MCKNPIYGKNAGLSREVLKMVTTPRRTGTKEEKKETNCFTLFVLC